jgi:hypothetical protein
MEAPEFGHYPRGASATDTPERVKVLDGRRRRRYCRPSTPPTQETPMKRTALALVAAPVLALGLAACSSDAPAPAPVVTVTAPAPETQDPNAFMLDTLDQVWGTMSYSDQRDLCTFYNMTPDGAYDAFNEGFASDMGTDFPQDVFDQFFSAECGSDV